MPEKWTLEQWSWVAAIAALPVTILVSLFTWFFKPRQFISFLRNWWGLFFIALVVSLLGMAFSLGWFSWLNHIAMLPVWVLLLLVFLGALLPFAAWLIWASLNKPFVHVEVGGSGSRAAAVVQPASPPTPPQPDWRNYVNDEVTSDNGILMAENLILITRSKI